jgi:hypothetical protein
MCTRRGYEDEVLDAHPDGGVGRHDALTGPHARTQLGARDDQEAIHAIGADERFRMIIVAMESSRDRGRAGAVRSGENAG